jgi:hypothetical protein
MLVASTNGCQHPSTTATSISNVCQVPPTTTHSFIVVLDYKTRIMPPSNVNGLMLATSHLHLPIYFLQLLQFLWKLRSLPYFVPSTLFLLPAFHYLLSFVLSPPIYSSFLAHLLSLILRILAPHLMLGIVCAGTSDNTYLSICTMIFIVTPMSQILHDNIHHVFTQVLLLPPAAVFTASHSAPSSISDGVLAMLVQLISHRGQPYYRLMFSTHVPSPQYQFRY